MNPFSVLPLTVELQVNKWDSLLGLPLKSLKNNERYISF